jgi:hypothetical protein
MNRQPRLSLVLLFALFVSPPLFAGNGGDGHSGGGHGGGGHGGGGHGGGHGGSGGHQGGNSGGGGPSGHSMGQSVGHAFAHIFGHGSNRRGTHSGENPGSRAAHNPARPMPVTLIHIRARRRMFHQNRLLGSGFCAPLRFSWRNFVFPGDFDCFEGDFLFDPFFYGGSLNTYFWSDSLINSGDLAGSDGHLDAVENDLPSSAEKPGAAYPLPSNSGEPVVLLQLLDGSMYGLTRYWLEGTELHYVTNYGGQNSVPLVRIDFVGTTKLNATRGIRFDVTRNFPNP